MIAVERFDLGGADDPDGSGGDSLSDEDLRSEIELVGELVVAASDGDEPLPQPEIDRILGVDPG
jgi:hypothetical protein